MSQQMRMDQDDNGGKYRICERHKLSHENRSVKVKHGEKEWYQRCELTLPDNIEPKSTANDSENTGCLGKNREMKQVLEESQKSQKIIQLGL